jgi:hypothetical protein
MFKKLILAVVVVFIAIEVMDFLLHGVILSGLYKVSTFWRPEAEGMKLMALLLFIIS